MWPFKFSGGDAAVVEDALPVCFYCFLDVESKRGRYLYPYEGVLQAKALHMGLTKTPFCADLNEDFCQTRLLVPDNLRTGVSRACRYDPDLNPPTKSLLCTT